MIKVLCYSGGKDSTAMLIHLLENDAQIDDILYVDVGNWMWKEMGEHLKKVEDTLNVNITVLDRSDLIKEGFERWGFPSIFQRWCTEVKKESMRKWIKNKYHPDSYPNEEIVQYIGYCADEEKRTNNKLFPQYKSEFPLVDAGITTKDALEMCYDYGFDFGGIYEHHSHLNCWMCPLQRVNELQYLFENEPELWDELRRMQLNTNGYYRAGETVFDLDKKFWLRKSDELKQKMLLARKKYEKK